MQIFDEAENALLHGVQNFSEDACALLRVNFRLIVPGEADIDDLLGLTFGQADLSRVFLGGGQIDLGVVFALKHQLLLLEIGKPAFKG